MRPPRCIITGMARRAKVLNKSGCFLVFCLFAAIGFFIEYPVQTLLVVAALVGVVWLSIKYDK